MWKISNSSHILEISKAEMKPLGRADVYTVMWALLRFFQYLYFFTIRIYLQRKDHQLSANDLVACTHTQKKVFQKLLQEWYRFSDIAKRNTALEQRLVITDPI